MCIRDSLSPRQTIDLQLFDNQLAQIEPGDMVIFKTNWSRHFGSEHYFENPFLDARLVEWLIESGVKTFGIDALNVDETPNDKHPGIGFPVHHLIAKAGGVICENLTNLDSVDFANPFVSMLPMKFVGIDGAPVRAVAMQILD